MTEIDSFKKSMAWWEYTEKWLATLGNQGKFWTEAYKIVRNTNESNLIDQLQKHFEHLLIFDRDLSVNFEAQYKNRLV